MSDPKTPDGWGSTGGGGTSDQSRGGAKLPKPADPYVPKRK